MDIKIDIKFNTAKEAIESFVLKYAHKSMISCGYDKTSKFLKLDYFIFGELVCSVSQPYLFSMTEVYISDCFTKQEVDDWLVEESNFGVIEYINRLHK